MGMVTNIPGFNAYWRGKYHLQFKDKTDEEVFNTVREQYPDLKLPSYDEALQYQITQHEQEQTPVDEGLEGYKTSPEWIDSWFASGSFIPESFRQEGFLGTSPEFWQDAYNKSMSGLFYQTMKGLNKYTVEDYNPSLIAQAGQFAAGLLSPMDALVMLSTGALGKVAGAPIKAALFGRGFGATTTGKKFLEKFKALSFM